MISAATNIGVAIARMIIADSGLVPFACSPRPGDQSLLATHAVTTPATPPMGANQVSNLLARSSATSEPAKVRNVTTNHPSAVSRYQPAARPSHSRSLSESFSKLVRPTKIISAIIWEAMIHGTPNITGISRSLNSRKPSMGAWL